MAQSIKSALLSSKLLTFSIGKMFWTFLGDYPSTNCQFFRLAPPPPLSFSSSSGTTSVVKAIKTPFMQNIHFFEYVSLWKAWHFVVLINLFFLRYMLNWQVMHHLLLHGQTDYAWVVLPKLFIDNVAIWRSATFSSTLVQWLCGPCRTEQLFFMYYIRIQDYFILC